MDPFESLHLADHENEWSDILGRYDDLAAQILNSDPLASGWSTFSSYPPIQSEMNGPAHTFSELPVTIGHPTDVQADNLLLNSRAAYERLECPTAIYAHGPEICRKEDASPVTSLSEGLNQRCSGVDRIPLLQEELARKLGLRARRSKLECAARQCPGIQDCHDFALGSGANSTAHTSLSSSDRADEDVYMEDKVQLPESRTNQGAESVAKTDVKQELTEVSKDKKRKAKSPTDLKKKERGQKISIHTKTDMDVIDDGFKWRKYGQKAVKNSPYPRSYYRCTDKQCKVKKHVERYSSDRSYLVTTYEGTHNHQSTTPIDLTPGFVASMFPQSSASLQMQFPQNFQTNIDLISQMTEQYLLSHVNYQINASHG